jgi:tetratricopeptide (TPR) repeat protein
MPVTAPACAPPATRWAFILVWLLPFVSLGAAADAHFREGLEAYRAADYARASAAFRESSLLRPASGTLQNLGQAEWEQGQTGPAILAWERALWVDPFNDGPRNDLRFARKLAQLEAPELTWYEVVSTWLPVNWWTWIAGVTFWFALGIGMLPGILGRRKSAWQQAFAAFGLTLFLLSLPAQFGVDTRSRIGFVLQKDSPLRLTPTADAQFVTRMAPGEPARLQRTRGRYLLVRTNHGLGWIERSQFGLICP